MSWEKYYPTKKKKKKSENCKWMISSRLYILEYNGSSLAE